MDFEQDIAKARERLHRSIGQKARRAMEDIRAMFRAEAVLMGRRWYVSDALESLSSLVHSDAEYFRGLENASRRRAFWPDEYGRAMAEKTRGFENAGTWA